jgi:transcriptional regulator with XRE-family HTH domain
MAILQLVSAPPHRGASVGRHVTELAYCVLGLRARGVFACDLARAAGMSPSVLSRLQHGHLRPTVEQATRLAELLERPVAELFPDLESDDAEDTAPPLKTPPAREASQHDQVY